MLTIRPIDADSREKVDSHIETIWHGPMIASRKNLIDNSKLDGFACFEDGVFAGAATYQITGDSCEIVTLFSLADGHGVGRALLNRMVEFAAENGMKRLWLVTTNDNIRAIRFYQQYGMELVALHRDAITYQRNTFKPAIDLVSEEGIPLRHEFEFEAVLPTV